MTSKTIKNLAANLENLNMTGTFDKTNATLNTAIPPASIGLYQSINELIIGLFKLKADIKTEEKKIQAVLAGDDFSTAYTEEDSSLTIANREAATISTSGRNELTATASSNFNKPAVWLGGATAGNLSEDAVFEMLQKMLHVILLISNNQSSATGLTVADFNKDATYSGGAS